MEYFQVLRNANDQEFFKLKEQLMMTFKDQMELRRSLMELGNTSMEISLESSRNTLILSDWETEQSKAKEVCERLDFCLKDQSDVTSCCTYSLYRFSRVKNAGYFDLDTHN